MLRGQLFAAVRTSLRQRTTSLCFKSNVGLLYLCQQCLRRYTSPSQKQQFSTPVFAQVEKKYRNKVAICDQHGNFTYNDLLHHSKILSDNIIQKLNLCRNLDLRHVAFLCENDVSYVISQWAIWMARGVAVPLCKSHPGSELEYVIGDAKCSIVVTTADFAPKIETIVKKLNLPSLVLQTEDYIGYYDLNQNAFYNRKLKLWRHCFHKRAQQNPDKPCLIIYTSGTTGRPKGVVLTYRNLQCNISGMIQTWGWTSNDVVLHVLPLHHVHGVVNALLVPLYCGATVVMMPKFDPGKVWEMLVTRRQSLDINVFMAVPTIYTKLIEEFERSHSTGSITYQYIKSTCLGKIRLMVSGSAALPTTVMEKWKEITGHSLLERYGMTELGMVLTNPLKGDRIPGAVGLPFPGVQVAIGKPDIKNPNTYDIIVSGDCNKTKVFEGKDGKEGELLVRGENVFKKYWNNPEATKDSFTEDGWFKTGDTAAYSNGVYRILGRTSVDIIKSGGYKISALDVERHLLEHPDIAECAVVGLPDITWGQKVAAVIATKSKECLSLHQLKAWCSDRIPSYQAPTVLENVAEIPRNAMGKINKKELVKTFFSSYHKFM